MIYHVGPLEEHLPNLWFMIYNIASTEEYSLSLLTLPFPRQRKSTQNTKVESISGIIIKRVNSRSEAYSDRPFTMFALVCEVTFMRVILYLSKAHTMRSSRRGTLKPLTAFSWISPRNFFSLQMLFCELCHNDLWQ